MLFLDNFASEEGGGMYVEYPSRDFILSVLNRGCFLQYFSDTLTTSHIDIPPNEWVSESVSKSINYMDVRTGRILFARKPTYADFCQ